LNVHRRSLSLTNTGGIHSCKSFSTMVGFIRLKFSIISLIFYRTRLKSRYLLSIFVGLSLGLALSLACLPLMSVCDNPLSLFSEPFSSSINIYLGNETSSFRDKFDPFRLLNRQSRSIADVTLVDYGSKDYEPRIHPLQQPSAVKSNNINKTIVTSTYPSNAGKVQRPRYIADELGIRDKVLVAVLTETNRLNTFALFHNQTLQHYVNRLLFFIDDDVQDFPKGMQVVAIHDKRTYLKPFYVLKYLAEKMSKSYDWFLLVPDNTYIRGFKVNSINDEREVFHRFFFFS
jgi:hypothetical protein